MTATYDVSTDRGRTRLLITDTDTDNPIFSDEEIDAFLGMYSQDVHLAAAEALDTIATSQALTLKVIRLLDLQTDGAKLSAELRARAAKLRELAETYASDDAGFEIAEMVLNHHGYYERYYDQALRGVV